MDEDKLKDGEQLCNVVIDPKIAAESNDMLAPDPTENEDMASGDMGGGDFTSKNPLDSNSEVANTGDSAHVLKSVSDSTENNDDMTGGVLTSKDPADSSVKKLGFCMIGGVNIVDLLDKDNQQLKDNTAANTTTSFQLASVNKRVTPVWKLSQHQSRSPSSAAISGMILKKIKPYADVDDIKSASTKFQEIWANSNTNKYSPTTPVLTIMVFISVLVKKKGDWTKTGPAPKLLHHTFVALSKTSPEVFVGDWKKNGDLHPSSAASLWTAAIKVLGCDFALKVQKGILKNDTKDLKVGGKKLSFDSACISIKTKTGRF